MRLNQMIYMVGSGDLGFNISHPLDCTVYLIDCGTSLALVDAGSGLDGKQILDWIQRDGFDPTDIEAIFLTHAHGDHVGGAAALQRITGATVYALEETARRIREQDYEAMHIPRAVAAGHLPPGFAVAPCGVTVLQDEERVKVGAYVFQAVNTPGHADGHACYHVYLPTGNALFVGDLLTWGGKSFLLSVADCRAQAYMASCKRIAEMDFTAFFPAHHTFALENGHRHADIAVDIIERTMHLPANMYNATV